MGSNFLSTLDTHKNHYLLKKIMVIRGCITNGKNLDHMHKKFCLDDCSSVNYKGIIHLMDCAFRQNT